MFRAALLAALLVMAGCQAPAAPQPAEPTGDSPIVVDPASGGDGAGSQDRTSNRVNGYAPDARLNVTNENGLNASEREAVVSRAMARVERVRGLNFTESVPVRVISRAEYRNRSGSAHDGARSRFDNAKFEALFMIGEDADSVSAQESTRGQNVLGYYSPSRDEIVIVSNSETPKLDGEGTLSHELVHALQDQHFDLTNHSARTRDAYQGRNGLVEGDAVYTQSLYSDRCGGEWQCLPRNGGSGSGGGDAHFGLQFLLYFPYSDGPELVSSLREGGNWSAVNAAYRSYPDGSTEVAHPERYDEWEPANVTIEDRTSDDWKRVRPGGGPDYGVPGQSAIAASLAYTLADDFNDSAVVGPRNVINYREDGSLDRSDPYEYDVAAAKGWAGGRFHAYRNGEDDAYVWKTRWENRSEAREFARAWERVVTHWGGDRVAEDTWVIEDGPFADAVAIRQRGATVTVVNAPDRAALSEVHDA